MSLRIINDLIIDQTYHQPTNHQPTNPSPINHQLSPTKCLSIIIQHTIQSYLVLYINDISMQQCINTSSIRYQPPSNICLPHQLINHITSSPSILNSRQEQQVKLDQCGELIQCSIAKPLVFDRLVRFLTLRSNFTTINYLLILDFCCNISVNTTLPIFDESRIVIMPQS